MDTETNRPYQCPHCTRRFTSKLFLKRHFAVHSASRNFKCEHCLSTYKYKKGLNRHIKKFHPEFYMTLKINPSKPRPKVKLEPNPSPIFKITIKTANGIIEEIPPVAPTFPDPDSDYSDQSPVPEEPKTKPEPNFFKFFMHKLTKSKVKVENMDKEPSLDGSLKEFNEILSENYFEYSSALTSGQKNEQNKGFVPLVDENGDKKSGSIVSHKKAECLEEIVRKYKTREKLVGLQIKAERQKQEKLKRRLERLRRLYRFQIDRKRKGELAKREVKVKIEEG